MKKILLAIVLANIILPAHALPQGALKAMAADAIAAQLLDPFSVKRARATEAVRYNNGAVYMCVRFYVKNRMGAYSGEAVFSVRFNKNLDRVKYVTDVGGGLGTPCPTSKTYRPFKELENF